MSLHRTPLATLQSISLSPGTQFLETAGARIAFDFEGSAGSSSLLVLVNGYQRTRLDFRAFRKRLAALAPDIATLALDNRGVGETRLAPGATSIGMHDMAADAGELAHAFSRKLGLEGCSLLGISMGGMISQTLAAEDSGVKKCVLVSTTAGGGGRVWPAHVTDAEEAQRFRPWPSDEEGMRRRMERYFGPRFLKNSPLLVSMMVKNMLKAYASPASAEGDAGEGSRLQFQASAGFDGTGLGPHIGCPTLVVTGCEDAIIPKENAYFLASHLPSATLVEYPDVGHLILVEEPEKFVTDVAKFLR